MPISRIPVSLSREEHLYYQGVALFNAGRFFEAHETWEEIWRPLPECPKRTFYHGLIQLAVAWEHFRRSNPTGVRRLYRNFRRKFAALDSPFMGLDLARLLTATAPLMDPLLAAGRSLKRGDIVLDFSQVPSLTLLTNPFITGEAARRAPPSLPPSPPA